jgi:hypothetical protein
VSHVAWLFCSQVRAPVAPAAAVMAHATHTRSVYLGPPAAHATRSRYDFHGSRRGLGCRVAWRAQPLPAITPPIIRTIIATIAIVVTEPPMPSLYPGLCALSRSTIPHFDR